MVSTKTTQLLCAVLVATFVAYIPQSMFAMKRTLEENEQQDGAKKQRTDNGNSSSNSSQSTQQQNNVAIAQVQEQPALTLVNHLPTEILSLIGAYIINPNKQIAQFDIKRDKENTLYDDNSLNPLQHCITLSYIYTTNNRIFLEYVPSPQVSQYLALLIDYGANPEQSPSFTAGHRYAPIIILHALDLAQKLQDADLTNILMFHVSANRTPAYLPLQQQGQTPTVEEVKEDNAGKKQD